MDARQAQSLLDFVNLCIQLLSVVRETRQQAPSLGLHKAVELRDAFDAVLRRLEGSDRSPESQAVILQVQNLVSDVLLRFDLLQNPPASLDHLDASESLARIWSDESLIRLETCVLKVQSVASSGTPIASNVGSRRLWTGPEHAERDVPQTDPGSPMTELLGNSSLAEDLNLTNEVNKTLSNPDKTELIQEAFLQGLKFAAMNDREEEVADAHHQTFEWILDGHETSNNKSLIEEANNFASWLSGENTARMYWINGKAGSGKSTLMRFLASHHKTTGHLNLWAAGLPLTVARFFFWTSGTALQRSQSGLLRALLFEILDHDPSIIPWAFPELWLVAQDTKKRIQILLTWEQADLLSGLRRALKLCASKGKICLFIDGLDEFEGEEGTVIGLMREIADLSPNIKLCVSSRPWAAFEKAFHNVPHILLQHLTRQDMDQYILDQFRAHRIIRNLIDKESSEFQALRSTMVEQANGVFLWTNLALRTIVADLPMDCCMDDIQKRLFQLPSDLEDLFRYLLFDCRKEENLSQHQSHIVQTIRARDQVCDATRDESVRAITLYQMALANSGSRSISDTVQQCDMLTLDTVCRDFADTLERSCSHLIVLGGQNGSSIPVHSHFGGAHKEVGIIRKANRRVHYLHRTVRDFFVSSGVWPEVLARGNSVFDPHVALLRSHVLRLRSPLEQPEQHRRLDEWWHDDVVPAMTHARLSLPATAATQVELLDQLDQTLNWYWRKKAGDPLDNWARQAFGSYEERMKHRTPFHHPFLSLAAKFGCAEYLHLKLSPGTYGFREGIPMLTHALDLLIDRRKTVYPLSSPGVIGAILQSGQNPNQPYLDMRNKPDTPWLYALKCVREGHRRGWIQSFDVDSQGVQRWVAIFNLMLDHGADAAAVIQKDRWDPETTAQGVIEAVAMVYFSREVWKLLEKLRSAAER